MYAKLKFTLELIHALNPIKKDEDTPTQKKKDANCIYQDYKGHEGVKKKQKEERVEIYGDNYEDRTASTIARSFHHVRSKKLYKKGKLSPNDSKKYCVIVCKRVEK